MDCLAVAIGNQHGITDKPPRLDLERLRAVRAAVSVPLALHGGSGVDDETLRMAVDLGLSKLNIAFAINNAFVQALGAALERAQVETAPGRRRVHPHKVLSVAGPAVRDAARDRMRVLGSSGKA